MVYAACMSGAKIKFVEREWSECPDAMRRRWGGTTDTGGPYPRQIP